MRYIKKYWKKVLLLMMVIGFPFALEWFLFVTPTVSRFSNETWFSFAGSYIGAVTTLCVMFITFKKSAEENRKIVMQQRKRHEIDMQNNKLDSIIHVLLLEDYYLLNSDTVCENINRFNKRLQYIQFDTLKLKYITCKDEALVAELLDLQMEEVEIINSMYRTMPHVNSEQKAEEFKQTILNTGLKLSKVANQRREIIKAMYDDYLEKVYTQYYE